MSLYFDEEHKMFRQMVRQFVEKEIERGGDEVRDIARRYGEVFGRSRGLAPGHAPESRREDAVVLPRAEHRAGADDESVGAGLKGHRLDGRQRGTIDIERPDRMAFEIRLAPAAVEDVSGRETKQGNVRRTARMRQHPCASDVVAPATRGTSRDIASGGESSQPGSR